MTSRAGYSLFEVLMAFAILSAVLAVLIPEQGRLLARSQSASAKILARDYAASEFARQGVSVPIEPGVSNLLYRDWTIETRIAEDRTADGSLVFWAIEIEVRDQAGTVLATATTAKPKE